MTAHAQNAKTRNITGHVNDVANKPVANATVTVAGGGPTTTTAADGSFNLTVATTDLVVEVIADGFVTKQIPVSGATIALDLSIDIAKPAEPLPLVTRVVSGVVSDPSGVRLAGVTVRVNGTSIEVLTAADGTFTLPGVAVAELLLDIEAPNQRPTSARVPQDTAAVMITVSEAKQAPPPPPTTPTSRTIRGKVIDPASRKPIAAAQIQVVGRTTVVFSKADGTFVMEGAELGQIQLDVSAPEHESHVVDVPADKNALDIPLGLARGEPIVIEARAPVIVTQNLVNGASVIDGKDLNRVPAATLDEALTGKLAGATLQANFGAPGGGPQLRLRGSSTIGQSSPLYVIDGVLLSNVATPLGGNAITGNSVNRIADLDPNDIETLEVLRGVSAAALYGAKAANGVVIITTRRGRNGENRAEVTQRFGISQVSNTLGARKFTSVDDVKATFGDNPLLVQAFMDANGKTYDHAAELTRTAFSRETIGNVSGGTENGNYYGSILVRDDPGVVSVTSYEKQRGQITVGYKLRDGVRLGLTANVIHSLSDRGLTNNDAGVSNYAGWSLTPSFFNLKPQGGVYPVGSGIPTDENPLQTVQLFQNREDVWRLIAGTTLSIDAYASNDGGSKIKVLGNFGADRFTQSNHLLWPNALVFEPVDQLPKASINVATTNLNWNVAAGLLWTYKPQSARFRSALSGGLTYESADLETADELAQNLNTGQTNDILLIRTVRNRLRTKDAGLYVQEELAVLDDQLSLLGGLLAEQASFKGGTNKYDVYPKVAAMYSLLKANDTTSALASQLDPLRVRAAYGAAARQREVELGVDAATQGQRVAAELTGYQRDISTLLLLGSPATSPDPGLNGVSIRNRGIEATIQVRPVAIKRIAWISRGTLTLNRSEITSLPANVPTFDIAVPGFGNGLGAFRIERGKSATQIVSTVDGNGTVKVVGDGEPDFRIGWSNVVKVGDFTFSALLDWQHGSDVINLTRLLYDAFGKSPDVAAAAMRVEKVTHGDSRPYIEDASFVKVREVSVTYSPPRRLASQLGPLKSLQLSLSGRNLLTFTGYSGLDPEVSNFGNQPLGRNFDVGPYPPSRSYWLSVSAGL